MERNMLKPKKHAPWLFITWDNAFSFLLESVWFGFSVTIWENTLTQYSIPGGSDGKESACNQETWVWSLGQEDPLEKGITTHSSILAWRIPWTEEPVSLSLFNTIGEIPQTLLPLITFPWYLLDVDTVHNHGVSQHTWGKGIGNT